jgi:hypothetical protein
VRLETKAQRDQRLNPSGRVARASPSLSFYNLQVALQFVGSVSAWPITNLYQFNRCASVWSGIESRHGCDGRNFNTGRETGAKHHVRRDPGAAYGHTYQTEGDNRRSRGREPNAKVNASTPGQMTTGVNRCGWWSWAHAVLFSCCVALPGGSTRAQQFEVTGQWTSRFFWAQTNIFDTAAEFRVSVQDCRWYIQMAVTTYSENGRETPFHEDYRLGAYDGSNIYELSVFEHNRLPGSTNVAAAKIMSGVAPHEFNPNLADLWLAFASHAYFKSVKGTTFIYPLISPRPETYYQKDYRVDARWELDPHLPGLPQYAAYSTLISADVQEQKAAPPGANLINTNLLYTVLEWTNFAQLRLPKRASVEKFAVPSRSRPATRLCEQVSIQVSRVADRCSIPSFTPRLPGLTALADRRFDSATPPYVQTVVCSDWPSARRAQVSYSSQLRARGLTTRSTTARAAVWGLLGLTTATPLILLIRAKFKTKMRK